MAFIELKSNRAKTSVYMGDKVKIYFNKTNALIIMIGKDIITRLGYNHGDMIRFYRDDENQLVWLLKKDEANLREWKLSDVYNNKSVRSKLYRLQIQWKAEWGDVPEKFKNNNKLFINWDIYQGGLRLSLPGGKVSDLSV